MLKTLLTQVKEYKKVAILTPILVILEVILEVAIPFLMSMIIDKGINVNDLDVVVKIGVIMLIASFVSLLAGALAGKYAAKASTGFAKNLRKAMYYNIQDFSFANIDKYSTAGLVTRLMTDVTNVQNAFQMIIRMCIRAPLMLICAMTMAFIINTRLALIFVVAIIFLGIVLTFIMTRAHPLFKRIFRTYDDLNASVQENISGIRVVKAYVREEFEDQKFKKTSGLIYKLFLKAENYLVFNQPLMQFTVYGCIIMISWFGAHMIVGGTLTTGELTSMFTYVMMILMSLMMLSMVFVMIVMSIASAQRISEVINEKSTLHNPSSPDYKIKDGSIDFNHVYFSYFDDQDEVNLRDINVHIKSGQTIGIIGGTGSAKSTFVQLIPRLYDVTKGEVFVGGKDVRSYDLNTLRNEVAMVLQKNVLFSGTIKENLRWGKKDATDQEIEHVCKLAQADEFIQRFPDKYDTYIEQGGSNVSGGQKQRLCIARALLKKPKILILDDSTSAVDTKTDALIRKAFREEIPGTTKIIIAQRISSVEDADLIIVLDDGKISAMGTNQELLKTCEIYQDIYQTQKKGGSLSE
ncbi:ABC transporter ATP-binding protein [Thomasclavelia cocleata]|uniref:ATP-binding cassette, subfamily B n=1 Tax=Thomasclavelia cocleata TaxID=69824 RepID=A0A1I0HS30_9FIRM|nr:ABC transporter ATP-binding protein [Thomasclavelia cocleata]MCR1961874.1 ABC transporter ATP-binding protein/permease [Thomasclavelia cocleata]NDO41332.1 ABC transporter ATP-binding protein [Thomasclavelia cocleata]PJN81364.1 ABC transporter ATP-binding protein [Thomasclavelia cocleata]SET86823.1 ATP-binding cassette, subfamily B [Thomasclavelia cocleata]